MCRVTCSGQEPTASLRVPFEWKPSKGGIVGAEAARSELPQPPKALKALSSLSQERAPAHRAAGGTRSETRSERRRETLACAITRKAERAGLGKRRADQNALKARSEGPELQSSSRGHSTRHPLQRPGLLHAFAARFCKSAWEACQPLALTKATYSSIATCALLC